MLTLNFSRPHAEWDIAQRSAAMHDGLLVLDADPFRLDHIPKSEAVAAIMPSELAKNDYALTVEYYVTSRFGPDSRMLMWDEHNKKFVPWSPWCELCGENRVEDMSNYCAFCLDRGT